MMSYVRRGVWWCFVDAEASGGRKTKSPARVPLSKLRASRRYQGDGSTRLDGTDRAASMRGCGERAEFSRDYFGDGDGFDGLRDQWR